MVIVVLLLGCFDIVDYILIRLLLEINVLYIMLEL